jgi:hypothetical protein
MHKNRWGGAVCPGNLQVFVETGGRGDFLVSLACNLFPLV